MDPSDIQNAHRHFAVDAFNACWQLIDLPARTPQENRKMIRLAESSYWHWTQVADSTAENETIGLWQLARAYVLAGEAETASSYAKSCLKTAQLNHLGPFHEGYALEATARVYQALGMKKESAATQKLAWAMASKIDDLGSRELLETDLQSLSPTESTE